MYVENCVLILLLHRVPVIENELSPHYRDNTNCLLLPGLHVSVYRDTLNSAHIYDPHVAKHFFLTVNQVIFGNNKFE